MNFKQACLLLKSLLCVTQNLSCTDRGQGTVSRDPNFGDHRNYTNGNIGGPEEDDSWKILEVKISRHLPFKALETILLKIYQRKKDMHVELYIQKKITSFTWSDVRTLVIRKLDSRKALSQKQDILFETNKRTDREVYLIMISDTFWGYCSPIADIRLYCSKLVYM